MSSLFRSIRFNVGLFLAIALLSALGTFLPQWPDSPATVQALLTRHPFLARGGQVLGLFDVYHSFIFAGLLGLMAFDVILCKLVNRPPDPGLVPLAEDEAQESPSLAALRKKPYTLQGILDGPLEVSARSVRAALRSHHYHVREEKLPDGTLAIFGARHRLQRWGSYISHISLVVILLGAMMKSLLGFDTMLPVLEGHSVSVAGALASDTSIGPGVGGFERLSARLREWSIRRVRDWSLSVLKFTVDFYPGTSTASTYASEIRLQDSAHLLASQTLRVNQPVDVRHVRFYQASWGVTGMVRSALLHIGSQTRELGMGESFAIPATPRDSEGRSRRWTGQIEKYLPDFVFAPDGQPSTASLDWKNPALVIGYHGEDGRRLGSLVLSAPSPMAPGVAPWAYFLVGNRPVTVSPPFEVLAARPILFSGIQVSYDPGFPVIVAGVLAMLLGLCALFYLHQRRVTVLLKSTEHGTQLQVGAWSSRGPRDFGAEFRSLFHSIGSVSEIS